MAVWGSLSSREPGPSSTIFPLQHQHPVAEATGHRQVVGDKQHPQPQALLQLPQQGQHICLHLGIQHADALIAEQHLGLQDQGTGNRYPLLLTTRECAGQAVFKAFRG